jgi:hypothetical protein
MKFCVALRLSGFGPRPCGTRFGGEGSGTYTITISRVRASEDSGFPALGNQTGHSAGEQQGAVQAVHTIHSNDRH